MLKPKDKRIEIIPEGEQKVVEVCREGIVIGDKKPLTLKQGDNVVEYDGSEEKTFEVAGVDLSDYYTKTEADNLLGDKQDELTAGNGIVINADTVSKIHSASGEVKLITHRGAMVHAPENTIPAFEIAGQQGFYGIEFDVIQTADDEFVVFHDTTADRMTDGTGRIQDMTLSEVQALTIDAGVDVEYYPDLKIPTLDQTLQAIRKTNAVPIIELKYAKTANFADIVDIVAANGMLDRAVFISFFESYLDAIRAACPEARVWLVVNQVTEQIIDRCAAKGFGVDAETWTQDLVKYANKKNVEVASWSSTNQASYLSREEIGVEFITTNAIEWCRVMQSPNTVDGSGFTAYSNYEALCLTLGKYIPRQLSGSAGLEFTSVIYNSNESATRGFIPKIYRLNGATAINYNFTDTKYEGLLVTLRFFDNQHKQLTDKGWFGHGFTTFTDIPDGAEYCFVYAGTAAGIARMTYARQQLLAEMVRSISFSYGGA